MQEVERRVQIFEIENTGSGQGLERDVADGEGNPQGDGLGLNRGAQDVVGEWLREKIDEEE
jgi:hypothetical protein